MPKVAGRCVRGRGFWLLRSRQPRCNPGANELSFFAVRSPGKKADRARILAIRAEPRQKNLVELNPASADRSLAGDAQGGWGLFGFWSALLPLLGKAGGQPWERTGVADGSELPPGTTRNGVVVNKTKPKERTALVGIAVEANPIHTGTPTGRLLSLRRPFPLRG